MESKNASHADCKPFISWVTVLIDTSNISPVVPCASCRPPSFVWRASMLLRRAIACGDTRRPKTSARSLADDAELIIPESRSFSRVFVRPSVFKDCWSMLIPYFSNTFCCFAVDVASPSITIRRAEPASDPLMPTSARTPRAEFTSSIG